MLQHTRGLLQGDGERHLGMIGHGLQGRHVVKQQYVFMHFLLGDRQEIGPQGRLGPLQLFVLHREGLQTIILHLGTRPGVVQGIRHGVPQGGCL